MHTETRQEQVLKMTVEPTRLRLKEVPAPVPPEQSIWTVFIGDRNRRMVGKKATMADLAESAGELMNQRVIDETNLKGHYDLDFEWPESPGGSRLGPDGVALFMKTMNDRFGVQFSEAIAPREYWVIDRIERPRKN